MWNVVAALLLLLLQVWAMLGSSLAEQGPPHIEVLSRKANDVQFGCRSPLYFPFEEWVLYRNSVPENTTAPCTSTENYSDKVLNISSLCDGLYSCAVQHTACSNVSMDSTALVLSEPLPVYGKCVTKYSISASQYSL